MFQALRNRPALYPRNSYQACIRKISGAAQYAASLSCNINGTLAQRTMQPGCGGADCWNPSSRNKCTSFTMLILFHEFTSATYRHQQPNLGNPTIVFSCERKHLTINWIIFEGCFLQNFRCNIPCEKRGQIRTHISTTIDIDHFQGGIGTFLASHFSLLGLSFRMIPVVFKQTHVNTLLHYRVGQIPCWVSLDDIFEFASIAVRVNFP